MVKILICFLFSLTLVYLMLGVYRGRVVSVSDKKNRGLLVQAHRGCFKKAVLPFILALIMVELTVRFFYNPSFSILFSIHLAFAVSFLKLSFTTYFFLNGLKKPQIHAKLGYACFLLYILTYINGMALLFKL